MSSSRTVPVPEITHSSMLSRCLYDRANAGSRGQAYRSHWKVIACREVATPITIRQIELLPGLRILLC